MYRLINGNELAKTNLNIAKMPCIYADLPNGLDNKHYEVIEWHPITTRKPTIEELEHYHDTWGIDADEIEFVYDCVLPSEDNTDVLITTSNGEVTISTFYSDYSAYFEGYEDENDVLAWAYRPGAYKKR